ncbi:hypothetical protein BvCmsKSP013_00940 [Escherichia coli]|nr:hypothetical protein JNE072951_0914 [Escherichia coli]BDQ75280.1 hypothetical protein JNE110611_0919 [Escherichia coli]BDQ80610.1 hypothetical protein PV0671_0921 [Escherichia coli]GDK61074.1 hypothetical protein BvCmsKSP013_00940 [Escherichia coli]
MNVGSEICDEKRQEVSALKKTSVIPLIWLRIRQIYCRKRVLLFTSVRLLVRWLKWHELESCQHSI